MSAGHPYTSQRLSYRFLFAAGVVLLLGISAGTLGAIQFGWGGEGFLGDVLPFYKLRPLHVTFVIAWLFVASMGGLFYALPEVSRRELYSVRLGKWQFWIMTWTGLGILATYGAGIFSGREYFNFWPPFALAILVAWALFCINVFKTIKGRLDRWPVYLWMWVTGLVVFVYTFLEGHLWLLPFFRDNIARDLTVQWKSYGSFIGSWNMLIYGLLFYLMQRLEGEGEVAKRSRFTLWQIGKELCNARRRIGIRDVVNHLQHASVDVAHNDRKRARAVGRNGIFEIVSDSQAFRYLALKVRQQWEWQRILIQKGGIHLWSGIRDAEDSGRWFQFLEALGEVLQLSPTARQTGIGTKQQHLAFVVHVRHEPDQFRTAVGENNIWQHVALSERRHDLLVKIGPHFCSRHLVTRRSIWSGFEGSLASMRGVL